MTTATVRPLTAEEAAYRELDTRWRRLSAELDDADWCSHFFRYRSDCRRCGLHRSIDETENALARLAGHEPPNQTSDWWQGED